MSHTKHVPPEVLAWQRELGAKAQQGLLNKFLVEIQAEYPDLTEDEQLAQALELKRHWLSRLSRRGVTRRQALLTQRRANRVLTDVT